LRALFERKLIVIVMRRPKGIKTNKATAKRFKISAGGKVKFTKPGRRHLMQSKGPKRRRGLRAAAGAHATDVYRITQNLPFSR
jgi:large subunit ribosomal protein L35